MHFFGKLSLGALVVSLGGCIAFWDLDDYDHPIADSNTGGGGGSVSGGGNVSCGLNDKRECYTPGLEVERVGACKTGFESCIEEGWSGICAGEVTPIAGEICRNGVQDTCNKNLPDADCVLDPAERRRIGTAGHEAALTVTTVPGGLGAIIGGVFKNSLDFGNAPQQMQITGAGNQGFMAFIDSNGNAKWAIPVDASTTDSNVQSVAIGQDGIVVGMSYTAQNGEAAVAFRSYASSVGIESEPSQAWTVPIQPVYLPKTGAPAALVAASPDQSSIFVVGVLATSTPAASLPPCVKTEGMLVAGSSDTFIMKLDSMGVCQWLQVIHGGSEQIPRAIAMHNDAVYIAGSCLGSVNWPKENNDKGSNGGAFVMKVAVSDPTNGNNPSITWTRTFPQSGSSAAFSIAAAGDYGVVFGGEFKGNVEFISGTPINAPNTDAFVALIDINGYVKWVRHFPAPTDFAAIPGTSRRISGVGYANDVIYATGTYDESIDLDPLNNIPNNASDIATPGGLSSAFFTSLNPTSGALRWFDTFASDGSLAENHAYLAADGNNVVLTGGWSATLTPDVNETLLGYGESDIYFASYPTANLP